ncbi:aspartate beta-hydroxylase domain-containing protein 2-like [Centruroides vittatus]|uniref:aspartate beta-hydroxylase domain-containing protein 2-like n=1 Tax=Centruroides vittatus TaxID=120091 RepID=UPI0035102601
MEIFEKCCGFIYESVDTPVALLIGTAVVATLIYFYNRKFHAKKWNDGVCQAPSCLRCNSGDSFRERTVRKFQNYLEECRNPEMLSDLKEAIMAKGEIPETGESLQRPTLLWLKRIEPIRWYDATHVHEKDVEILENNLSIILDEFRSLEGKPGWIVNQANPGCWRIYHLMSQGIFTVNATVCPRTVDVLRRLSGLMVGTVFGYASFSVLDPGTAVAPHFGATNCRIRCHLGLQVDPTTCYLVVGNEKRFWENGKCLLFDDSFLHSAHHEGTPESKSRAVLMVDLWHSELNEEEIGCVRSIYSSDLIFECTSFTNTD